MQENRFFPHHSYRNILLLTFFLTCLLISNPSFVFAGLSDGLVAYFPFECNTNDASGNGNHGVPINGITYEQGQVGSAAVFNGIDDYVRVGNIDGLEQLTVSAWFKTSSKTCQTVISDYLSCSWTPGFILVSHGESSNNNFRLFTCDDARNGSSASYINDLNDGIWHHVTGVISDTGVSLYVDGEHHVTVAKHYTESDRDIIIGYAEEVCSIDNLYFEGLIDEVRIYDRALSTTEIAELYDGNNYQPSEIDHFVISPISSPQTVDVPFSVTITAVNEIGQQINSFSGDVYISSDLGKVYPIKINLFSGQGTEQVTVFDPGADIRLSCSGQGRSGNSNYFSVTDANGCSGSIAGSVIDCQEVPVAQATVYLLDRNKNEVLNTETDDWGLFDFELITCGNYEINVEKNGETGIVRSVLVGKNRCTTNYETLLPINCGSEETPVVLIPGMMGSSVSDWGITPELPLTNPANASDLFIHLDHKIKGTGFKALKKELSRFSYVVQCPWDWRLNSHDASQEYLIDKIDLALKKSTTGKVHIVAHSMGGLVARAYIQSKSYRGDIDKVAFVGTPHLGSCNPYYIWEGGDPKTLDDLTDGAFISAMINPYTRTIKGLLETYDTKFWGLLTNDEIRSFIRDTVDAESLLELMYTGDFLTDGTEIWGTTGSNKNNWLTILNTGLGDYVAPSSVISEDGTNGTKVEARLFVGESKESTIERVIMRLKKGSEGATNDLYEDGIPRDWSQKEYNVVWGKGDGTVPYDSATFPYSEGWAEICEKTSEESHFELIKDFTDEIVAFMQPATQNSYLNISSDEEESIQTITLTVSIKGNMEIFITDSQNRKTGVDTSTGKPEMEIPNSRCAFKVNGGATMIEDPETGTYQVTYFGERQRDFTLKIEYIDSNHTELNRFRGFCPNSPQTVNIIYDPVNSNKLQIEPSVDEPTNVLADPYLSGEIEKTRISWSGTGENDLSGYNVYAKAELEPYFSFVDSVSAEAVSYDTNDLWSSDGNVTIMTYAVTAVKTDGTESFFSNQVLNNDRDHDKITDERESSSLGTDPNNPDTDGDKLIDGDELNNHTNPMEKDTDKDGYDDFVELLRGSDPLDPDSIPKPKAMPWLNLLLL